MVISTSLVISTSDTSESSLVSMYAQYSLFLFFSNNEKEPLSKIVLLDKERILLSRSYV